MRSHANFISSHENRVSSRRLFLVSTFILVVRLGMGCHHIILVSRRLASNGIFHISRRLISAGLPVFSEHSSPSISLLTSSHPQIEFSRITFSNRCASLSRLTVSHKKSDFLISRLGTYFRLLLVSVSPYQLPGFLVSRLVVIFVCREGP